MKINENIMINYFDLYKYGSSTFMACINMKAQYYF